MDLLVIQVSNFILQSTLFSFIIRKKCTDSNYANEGSKWKIIFSCS